MTHSLATTIGRAALVALGLATAVSCTAPAPKPAETITSAGRGAPVSPAIPWETWRNADDIEAFPLTEIKGYPEQHWLVGPFDAGASGNRLKGFLGAAQNGAAP